MFPFERPHFEHRILIGDVFIEHGIGIKYLLLSEIPFNNLVEINEFAVLLLKTGVFEKQCLF